MTRKEMREFSERLGRYQLREIVMRRALEDALHEFDCLGFAAPDSLEEALNTKPDPLDDAIEV